jgi:hypothetical protein
MILKWGNPQSNGLLLCVSEGKLFQLSRSNRGFPLLPDR